MSGSMQDPNASVSALVGESEGQKLKLQTEKHLC